MEHGPPSGPPPWGDGDPGPPPGMGPDLGPPREGRLRLFIYFLRYFRPVKGLVFLLICSTIVSAVIHLPMTFLPKVYTENFEADRPFLYLYFVFVLVTLVMGSVGPAAGNDHASRRFEGGRRRHKASRPRAEKRGPWKPNPR